MAARGSQHSLFSWYRPAALTGPLGPTSFRLAPAAGAREGGIPLRDASQGAGSDAGGSALASPPAGALTSHNLHLRGEQAPLGAGHAVAKPATSGRARASRGGRGARLGVRCVASWEACAGRCLFSSQQAPPLRRIQEGLHNPRGALLDALAKQHQAVALVELQVGRDADAGGDDLRGGAGGGGLGAGQRNLAACGERVKAGGRAGRLPAGAPWLRC